MTQFAVATTRQAKYLREVKDIGSVGTLRKDKHYLSSKGWVERHAQGRGVQLTPAGHVALELAVAMEGEKLTPAMARALKDRYLMGIWRAPHSATFRRLADAGLQRDGDLTDRGERVSLILRKYHVEF